jgi:hypothetical protein
VTSPLIDENALLRRIEGIERQLRELGPSIAKSFGSTVADIEALLATTVDATSVNTGTSGFVVPSGSSAAVLTTSVSVPLGYTRAAVMAAGTVNATNNSGSVSYLYAGIDIGASAGGLTASMLVADGAYGTVVDHNATVLTGLTPGGTFDIVVRGKGDPSWVSSSGIAILSAIVTFLH